MSGVDSPKKKILVVDDSLMFLKLVTSLLSDEFSLLEATSGEEAIEMLKKAENDPSLDGASIDMVITDFEMPGMSGFDVAEFVRERNKEKHFIPVIMLTGKDVTKEEARKHGCAAFIEKNNLPKVKSMARILLTR